MYIFINAIFWQRQLMPNLHCFNNAVQKISSANSIHTLDYVKYKYRAAAIHFKQELPTFRKLSARLGRTRATASLILHKYTKDGSTDVVPQILYGPYLILGVFGSCMF